MIVKQDGGDMVREVAGVLEHGIWDGNYVPLNSSQGRIGNDTYLGRC